MCVPAEHEEPAAARPADFGSITLRKITLRLIPFLFLLYIVTWLDRVNVGFAALQMHSVFRFSSAAFGFGSGVFFLGYCLFEVPSNLVLHRVGARHWISRIMISWGAISVAMLFVRTTHTFYVLRVSARRCGGGFLSRCGLLPESLVSGGTTCARNCSIHNSGSGERPYWRTAIRRAFNPEWIVRGCWMAVALSDGRSSRDFARRYRSHLSNRPT